MTSFKKFGLAKIVAVFVFVALVSNGLYAGIANAASLTSISDIMSNETLSAASSHVIKFTTPTGITAAQTIVATFPAGFNFTGKSFTGLTMSFGPTTGLETAVTLAAAPSGATWGAVLSGSNFVVTTFTSATGAIPAGNTVVF